MYVVEKKQEGRDATMTTNNVYLWFYNQKEKKRLSNIRWLF